MKTIVIVGGGIAGIYSAIIARKNSHRVILIEQSEELGGLLKSKKYENGDSFDIGTHFIAGTNIPEIDNVILNEKFRETWAEFPNENAGNFFAGKLTEDCIFVHTQHLPQEEYNQGVVDLLEALPGKDDEEYANSEEFLVKNFGKGFTKNVYSPALNKLFGTNSLSELHFDAHKRFGMKRIVIGSPESTRLLKKLPYLDEKIAFHQFSEGAASKIQYYPKENGSGEWIDYLEEELRLVGVEILTSTSVVSAEVDSDGIVLSVELSSGLRLAIDELIWTAPIHLLMKATSVKTSPVKPTLRRTLLLNYTFDKAPETTCHFFFCYDPKFLPFRVTLYSNLQPEFTVKSGRHRVTVEVLAGPDEEISDYSSVVHRQLVQMGVIKETASILFADSFVVPQGFPVLSHGFVDSMDKLEALAIEKFKNVTLVGRSTSKTWFMVDVFVDIYKKVRNL